MQHTRGSPQQFCLRWNNYQSNLTNVFDQLLQNESFVDVTLACDGHSIKAHKMVLSACSPYFQSLFFENPCQHPIVIMRDIKWPELKAAVEFMYKGEINVSQEQIGPLLRVAESLKIRGLADVNGEHDGISAGEITARSSPLKPPATPGASSMVAMPSSQNNADWDGGASSKKRRRSDEGKPTSPSEAASNDDGSEPLLSVETSSTANANHPANPPSNQANSEPPMPLQLPISATHLSAVAEDMEIKPGIAEMIREEERAKLLESSHAWLGASTSSIAADSYQYQLQSMWQKCWNTNQSLVHHLRFRERGPLKSWRPETMAEAIFSVLKEGLSLSQAARKYDIPYPTFVLYANRVHNMLGPSADGGSDLRPKGRGRPQRILLGIWPDEHIRGVIKAVVFRDSHHIKEEQFSYPRIHDGIPGTNANQNLDAGIPHSAVNLPNYPNNTGSNGSDSNVSPGSAAAAAVAAVAQGFRQQMCHMVAAANQNSSHDTNPVASLVNSLAFAGHCGNMQNNGALPLGMLPMGPITSLRNMSSPPGSIQDLRISPAESALESPISSPLSLMVPSSMESGNTGNMNMTSHNMEAMMNMSYKQPQRPFSSPRPENLFQDDINDLVKHTSSLHNKDTMTVKMEPMAECRGD